MEDSTIFFDSHSSKGNNAAVPTNLRSSYEVFKSCERIEIKKSIQFFEPLSQQSPSKHVGKYFKLIDQSDINWFAGIFKQKVENKYENSKSKSETNSQHDSNKTENFLSYTPILCPIFSCEIHFLPNDLVMHFLSFHHNRKTPILKLHPEKRLLISLKPFELSPGKVVCLGLVSYCGRDNKSPTENKCCHKQNLILNPEFENLKGDFPVLVLASVISIGILSGEEQALDDLDMNVKKLSTLLMVWLVSTNIDISLCSSMTTYDEYRLYSRSVFMGLHSLFEYQSPHDIYRSSDRYFTLHFKEWSTFVNEDMILKLELIFHED